tara:strand:- start:118207 stop:118338 length:132 start_codon:yes stop_codon:yes gene_type:complete
MMLGYAIKEVRKAFIGVASLSFGECPNPVKFDKRAPEMEPVYF